MTSKHLEIDGMFGVIDLWASNAVRSNKLDGASVYNPYNAKELAEALYNAGYRKTFTSANASETQKAFKEGYQKGVKEMQSECGICNRTNLKRIKIAVKEFAEKLKEKAFQGYQVVNTQMIDELLKECEQ